jgi:hypothetical protein
MKMYVTNKYKIVKPKKEPFVILVSKDFNKVIILKLRKWNLFLNYLKL